MIFNHKSVLLNETVDSLCVKPQGIYVDGTLGGGGHASEVAARLGDGGRLIGIDQDADAIAAASERLAPFGDKITVVRSNYERIAQVLDELEIPQVDGIYLDLGVSSFQLDTAERGFTYREDDAPLDMRMDRRAALTAHDIVNTWSAEELKRILYEYGEERYAGAIARSIVRAREDAPIGTTLQLVEVIRSALPAAAKREKQHPAKRSFQAIRIAVNDELGVLEPMLRGAVKGLNPGGRLCVITFHSLEDRIVKKTMQALAQGCTCPPDFPVCVCGNKPKVRIVSRKPILPGQDEIMDNPRARSAKLRIAERTEFEWKED